MKIRLNKAHFPVTALGPGKRIGLWLQGCHIHCPGCVSRDTWEPDKGREINIQLLLTWCRNAASEGCDGITISGGEPFEQPEALAGLIDGLASWRCEFEQPFDILCYSGFSYSRLKREFCNILSRLDAIISEPYIDSLPRGKIWRGSANQLLIPLSSLGHGRYGAFLDAEPDGTDGLQIALDAESVWYIGIPNRGDMKRLEQAVQERGVRIGGSSWRA